MKSGYKINGVEIKRPSDFKTEFYRITKASRTASGKMVMDNIARKRKFFLSYGVLDDRELQAILNIIWETDNVFFTFEYVEGNEWKSATCYVGAIPKTLLRTGGVWFWKDVTMNFIEQ